MLSLRQFCKKGSWVPVFPTTASLVRLSVACRIGRYPCSVTPGHVFSGWPWCLRKHSSPSFSVRTPPGLANSWPYSDICIILWLNHSDTFWHWKSKKRISKPGRHQSLLGNHFPRWEPPTHTLDPSSLSSKSTAFFSVACMSYFLLFCFISSYQSSLFLHYLFFSMLLIWSYFSNGFIGS